MNKILSLIIFLAIIFFNATCKKTTVKPVYGLYKDTIIVNGKARRYAVYTPQGIENKSVPLVIVLHGGGVAIEYLTGENGNKSPYKLWMDLANKEKFIVVYPEGLPGIYGKPTWNDCRADCIVNSNADDVHFIDTLITILSKKYKIDTNRIYVSGTSNGGFMALRLAVELSDKIAAVAAVAAAMPAKSKCSGPKDYISVLFMNGTNDNHMPYNGGLIGNPPDSSRGSVLSTPASVKFWINFNHTDTVPEFYAFPDIDPSDGSYVEKYTYSNGYQNTQVVLYKIIGGGHSAPSIKEQFSALYERFFNKQNHDIETSTEVWNFFKDKTLH